MREHMKGQRPVRMIATSKGVKKHEHINIVRGVFSL